MYFAVPKKGAKPIDGRTDANPEGLTGVTGKHAQAFADRLAAGDLSCKVQPAVSSEHAIHIAISFCMRIQLSAALFKRCSNHLLGPSLVSLSVRAPVMIRWLVQVLDRTQYKKAMLEKLIWIR